LRTERIAGCGENFLIILDKHSVTGATALCDLRHTLFRTGIKVIAHKTCRLSVVGYRNAEREMVNRA
jgi:hypothetical protein